MENKLIFKFINQKKDNGDFIYLSDIKRVKEKKIMVRHLSSAQTTNNQLWWTELGLERLEFTNTRTHMSFASCHMYLWMGFIRNFCSTDLYVQCCRSQPSQVGNKYPCFWFKLVHLSSFLSMKTFLTKLGLKQAYRTSEGFPQQSHCTSNSLCAHLSA